MKATASFCAVLLMGCATLPLFTQEHEETAPTPVILGTYDSRVVALAYYRSAEFEQELHAYQESATGEDMQALQDRMHRQGFGTDPVPRILERLASELPSIAAETGVDVVVNRWALDYRNDKAQALDISFRLAQEFSPSEDTLRVMHEIAAQEPVADEELDHPH